MTIDQGPEPTASGDDRLDPDDLAAWEIDALPESFDDQVMSALAEDPIPIVDAAPPAAQTRASRWRLGLSVAGIAAAVAAAVVLMLDAGRESSTPQGELMAIRDPRTVDIGPHARATVSPGAALRWEAHETGIEVEQSVGTVRYEVDPGHAFSVRTQAGLAAVTGSTFTVEVDTMATLLSTSPRRARVTALGGAAIGATALAFIAVEYGDVEVTNDHGALAVAAGQSATLTDTAAPSLDPPPPRPANKSPALAKAPKADPKDRRKRDAIKARIEAAIAGRPAAPPPAEPEPEHEDAADELPEASVAPGLSKDYIRERIREDLLPLARDCYNSELEDDPEFGGRLTLSFRVMGDESVGGVVDGVTIGEDSTIADPDFVECMSESMMTVVFDPPEGGGEVHITYPFIFEPG